MYASRVQVNRSGFEIRIYLMDHSLYDYSALPKRPSYRWPGDRGLAAYAVLFLEHWDFTTEPGALRDPRMVGEFGSFDPDYRSWSQREYGLRIGIFRVIEALKEAGIRPVIAANAMAVERLPRLVETFNAWGCDWLGHGIAATRMMHAGMSVQAQRDHVGAALAAIESATGARPTGWVSQDWGSTPDTFDLLAEAGITCTLDWSNDDQPYALRTASPLLAVPLSSEWDDVQCQWLRHIEPRDHAALAEAAFARLHAECDRDRRAAVFGLSIHPWLSGMPSRIHALRTLLANLKARPDVWWTTPVEIRRAYLETRAHDGS
jgi:allantoinase